nr:hypothetical protein [Thermoanaerobacter sp. YS13]
MKSNLEKTILQEMKEREKIGMKKGMKKGMEKGMEKGIGVTVLKLLEKKFGSVLEE